MARNHLLLLAPFLTSLSAWMSSWSPVHAQTQASPAGPDHRRSISSSGPSGASLAPIFGRIWHITKGSSVPPAGSIYVFLPNGTLLETSCVETYRVATWTADKNAPRTVHVVEDKRLAFTAVVTELTPSTLKLEQRLSHGNEEHVLILTKIEGEYVCPDMPK